MKTEIERAREQVQNPREPHRYSRWKRVIDLHASFGWSPNLFALRAFSRAASSSRFLGGVFVSSDLEGSPKMLAMAAIAAKNASSLALEGLVRTRCSFSTNWRRGRLGSHPGETGGSKLNNIFIFDDISRTSMLQTRTVRSLPEPGPPDMPVPSPTTSSPC